MRSKLPILLLLFFLTSFSSETEEVKKGLYYVAENGLATNTGGIDNPLTFEAAIVKAKELISTSGMPDSGIEIIVRGGTYYFKKSILLDDSFKGSEGQPIVIRAAKGENVIFDGSSKINSDGFAPITDSSEKKRLSSKVADKIYGITITDQDLISNLSSNFMQNLIFNNVEYLPSVFPNEGTANFQSSLIKDEVSPPAVPIGKEGYGIRAGSAPYQESGKAQGWRGDLDNPRGATVQFNVNADKMAGSWKQWEDELKRYNNRNQLTGYIEANWLLSSQPIYAASASQQAVQLTKALAYGWAWRNDDKPFRVYGMMCEIDSPGEWHFDPTTKRLFLYPPSTINDETEVKISLSNGFLELSSGAEYIHIKNITVQNVSSGTVIMVNGDNNLIAGCTIQKGAVVGIRLNGSENRVEGCNLIDLNSHVNMGGGVRNATEITLANNLVQNCHIYQNKYEHQRVNIGIGGVGNTFRNNLVHNSIGQAISVRGNEHVVERNEIFNVGFKEGDGGAIYSGGDMTGYGNLYKHNFIHHLIHCPGKVERAGIFMDDMQAGATLDGNIFYKSATVALKFNAGAAHRVINNVMLEGDKGVNHIGGNSAFSKYTRQLEIDADPNHMYKNTKENYIRNAELVVGEKGWTQSPWKDKYPLFNLVMSDEGEFGRYWGIRYYVDNNYYAKNRYNHSLFSGLAEAAQNKNIIKNENEVKTSAFVSYENMNFKFKGGNYPNIPFNEIGLYLDEYRKEMPDKLYYRRKIQDFFKGVTSYEGTTETINTALLVENGPKIISEEETELPKPVGYWPMDETTGAIAEDEIGEADANWTKTDGEGLTWETGKVEGCATLNGSVDEYFKINTDPLKGAKALTISAWVKPETNTGYKGIVFTRKEDNSNNWGIALTGTTMDIRSSDESGYSDGVLYAGEWQHIAMTWENSGKKRLFVDGVLVSQETAITDYESNGVWWIGNDKALSGREFKGAIDELSMFDVALNLGTIKKLVEKGNEGTSLNNLAINETNIIDFVIDEQVTNTVIDYSQKTISVTVAHGTDISSLIPQIRVSNKATVSPSSGTSQDFSSTREYIVKSASGVDQSWNVNVSVDTEKSSDASIVSFSAPNSKSEAVINATHRIIECTFPYGTNLRDITPTIEVSPGASILPETKTAYDFTVPFHYKVTAADGTTQTWIVLMSADNQRPMNRTLSTIPGRIEAEHYNEGVNGVAYYDYEMEFKGTSDFRTENGVDLGVDNGAIFVGWTTSGEWLNYTTNITKGIYDVTFRVASADGNKRIVLLIDGQEYETTVPSTGGWSSYSVVKISNISLNGAMNSEIKIKLPDGGLNLDYIDFKSNNAKVEPVLGNAILGDGEIESLVASMVIDETNTYTNTTSEKYKVKLDRFNFYAHQQTNPITPFVVKVNGDNDFTVVAIGKTIEPSTYKLGENSLQFSKDDTVLEIEPGTKLAGGFFEAKADGSGEKSGSVVPYIEVEYANEIWCTGGTSSETAGSLIINNSPLEANSTMTDLKRFYSFNISYLKETATTNKLIKDQDYNLYPTLVKDIINVNLKDKFVDGTTLSIYNTSGAIAYTQQLPSSYDQIDLSNLPNGIYLVSISNIKWQIKEKIRKVE